MKRREFLQISGALGAAGAFPTFLGGCAATVHVPTPPPAPRAETRGPRPGPRHVWIDGHWNYDGHRYVWVAGRWTAPEKSGDWVAGRWVKKPRGWVWVPGHWR